MEKTKKIQLVLMVEDEIYKYLKLMSTLENIPMSGIVTVLVEEDMLDNEKIIHQFHDFIFQSRN
jgi:hypothetical protein